MPAFVVVRNLYLTLLVFMVLTDYFFSDIPLVYYIIPSLAFLLSIAIGSSYMSSNFFIKATTSLRSREKVIALTFDDGPSPLYTPAILDLLDKYKASATFFCIGKNIEKNATLTNDISKKGHTVGNHSYEHSNFFSFFGTQKVAKEIRKTNQLILEATGKACAIFRPPYGVTNPSIARATELCNMKPVGWNIRSFDTSIKEPEKVIKRITSKIKPGSIILLHDDRPNTAKILEAILLYARDNDYRCVLIPNISN